MNIIEKIFCGISFTIFGLRVALQNVIPIDIIMKQGHAASAIYEMAGVAGLPSPILRSI